MSQRRSVCDFCSIRRVRCDGSNPCAGCLSASIECTRLRPKAKSGPKGIRKKTLEKLAAAKRGYAQQNNQPPRSSTSNRTHQHEGSTPAQTSPTHDDGLPTLLQANVNVTSPIDGADIQPNHQVWPFKIEVGSLEPYLDIYHHKLYPVWPIVQKDDLLQRLQRSDAAAYMLALSVCAATILQLQLAVVGVDTSIFEPKSMLSEIEDLRRLSEYRENPSLDDLTTSFFMHVAYLQVGRRTTSTLLLREAISLAHMLDLHRSATYFDLESDQTDVQYRLRILWLLFITERAHATQYDIPCIMTIDPGIPIPDSSGQPFSLSAFTLLCKMFNFFHNASSGGSHSAQSLMAIHSQLQSIPALTQSYNDLQRADLSITQQWMRLMLWKLAVNQIAMTTDPQEDIQSMLFPIHVAKDLLSRASAFSIDTLEAHGPGMELKLFEIANTLADVMLCVPTNSQRTFEIVPQNFLVNIASILGRFRGGNAALLPILQSRLADVGLAIPAIPRVIDVTQESTDSSNARSLVESDEALGGSFEEDQLLTTWDAAWEVT